MNPSRVFELTNSLAILTWALMLFTPNWKYTATIVNYMVAPSLLAGTYVVLIFSDFQLSQIEITDIAGIRNLFSNDAILVGAWCHYLAFDLLVGCWMLVKSQIAGISHVWMLIPLLFTLIMGPLGLLLFIIVYLINKKTWPGLHTDLV